MANKDFKANKVIKTSIIEVKTWKTQGVVPKTIGEMIDKVYSLPKRLQNYEGFPFTSLDDTIEVEFIIYATMARKRKFRITPIIVKIEEIIIED